MVGLRIQIEQISLLAWPLTFFVGFSVRALCAHAHFCLQKGSVRSHGMPEGAAPSMATDREVVWFPCRAQLWPVQPNSGPVRRSQLGGDAQGLCAPLPHCWWCG